MSLPSPHQDPVQALFGHTCLTVLDLKKKLSLRTYLGMLIILWEPF